MPEIGGILCLVSVLGPCARVFQPLERRMRIGYSILWGEIIDAAELDYGLTADLQIVFPSCGESLFKVERPLASGAMSHYLSHRPAADASEAGRQSEYENRVASLHRDPGGAYPGQSRGQSLEAFLSRARGIMDSYISVRTSTDSFWATGIAGVPGLLSDSRFLRVADSFAQEPGHSLVYKTAASIRDEMDPAGMKAVFAFQDIWREWRGMPLPVIKDGLTGGRRYCSPSPVAAARSAMR